jgi:hypothetical protein
MHFFGGSSDHLSLLLSTCLGFSRIIDTVYFSRKRRINLLWHPRQLKVKASRYNDQALLIGSGPSLTRFCALSSSIKSLYSNSFKLAINSSVFSTQCYDLCLFELTTNRRMRSSEISLFDQKLHLRGASHEAKFVFTHFNFDSIDDHISRLLTPCTYLCPETTVYLPSKQSMQYDIALRNFLKLHMWLNRLSIAPLAISIRSSAVRALLILITLGFKDIAMVGFDGGTQYYFQDRHNWPELADYADVYESVMSNPLGYESLDGGIKYYKKSHRNGIHSTNNIDFGMYTQSVLIQDICKIFNVSLSFIDV